MKATTMLERLWAQIGDLSLFACISVVFGFIKTVLSPDPCPWHCQVLTIGLAALIGTMAGGLAMQYHLGDYTALTLCSVSSLLSRDIVVAILNNRKYLGALLKAGMHNLMEKFTK